MHLKWRRLLWLPFTGLMASCTTGVEVLPTSSHAAVVNSSSAGLPQAPGGYQWFQSGQEYVLAAKMSGRVLRSVPAPNMASRSIDPFGAGH